MTTVDHRDRGAVIPIVALVLGVLILSCALAIDLGNQMMKRRDLQKLSDAIALDMSRVLDGSKPSVIEASAAWSSALAASQLRNNFVTPAANRQLVADAGCYDQATQVFTETDGGCTITPPMGSGLSAQSVATAVRVTATETVSYYFYPGSGTSSRTGIASRDGTLDYQAGSFLLATNTNQNALLNQILGCALTTVRPCTAASSFSVVSYQGLANGTFTLNQLAAAYGVGSPNELFTSNVNARQFFEAAAVVAQNNGASSADVAALRTFRDRVGANTQFDFGTVVDGVGSASGGSGSGDVFNTQMNLLNIIQGSAFAINGTNTINVPSLSITVPNLGTTALTLKVTEASRVLLGARVGDTLTTSQVEMTLVTNIDLPVTVAGVTGARVQGTITTSPTVAGAAVSPTSIRCADVSTTPGATIGVAADALSVRASENLTLSGQLLLLGNVPLLTVTASNAAVPTTTGSGSARFAYTSEFLPPVGTGGTQRAGSGTFDLAAALGTPPATATATAAGLTLPLGSLTGPVNTLLTNTVLPVITNTLVPLITQTLGLAVGGADVGAIQLHCNGVLLVGDRG
jgi:uncharacterized membrane protein